MNRYVEKVTVMVMMMMMMSILMVPSVMSGVGYEKMNDRQTSAINEAMIIASQKCIRSMSGGELPPVEELISALEYSGSEQIKAASVSPDKNISATIYGDITGDSITDVLMHVTTTDPITTYSATDIIAVDGSNGRELWEKTYTDCAARKYPRDLTNDGKHEVVISGSTSKDMSIVIAVNGADGMELWGEHYYDEIDVDFVDDLTGDGAKDLTVQIGCCELEGLRGYDGEKLWSIDV